MRIYITGIGWVTPSGIGRGRARDRFSWGSGELPALSRRELFSEPYPRFGRLDDFSRLGLSGIALALSDAGLDAWQEKRPIGIVAETRLGCLATDIAYFDTVVSDGGALASPNLFAYTLSNTFLGEAAIRFGLTGPAFVANCDGGNDLGCLRLGIDSLRYGDCPVVVTGRCDLAPPSAIPIRDASTGAIFLVLAAGGEGVPPESYGELRWDSSGFATVDGAAAGTWEELAAACIAGGG
ncbi:MAG: beta-ketoacyl synthase [Deltaproteobacteria bacterium]|nr:beta-ketoacyl synthase [Deltaproteobacteria bacterium]